MKTHEKSASENLANEYWNWRLAAYPEHATMYGYPGDHSSWTDMSEPAIGERKKWFESFLKQVESLEEDSLNRDLLRYEIKSRVEQQSYPNEYLGLTSTGGPHTVCAQILPLMSRTRDSHFEDMLSRLRAFPAYLEQNIDLMRSGLSQGITQPQVMLRNAPEQIRSQLGPDPIPVIQALGDVPSVVTEEAIEIFRGELSSAFERFADFVENEYIPKARVEVGLSSLDSGREWYQALVHYHTSSEMTPEEVHEVGLAEVARIRSLMDEIVESEGHRTLESFSTFLREDPRFYFQTADELLIAYRDICKRADPELARLFRTLPRLPYGVLPVPSYIERTTTTAYYQRGAPEVGRPGYFYANTYNLPARPKWEMEALSLHEAVPGHHLQIALASEIEEMPKFRAHFILTAYTEGWGLYAESLGEEMGFYKESYSRFGQLTYEMWRAIRLVVDTGIHALGWSRDRAIDYFIQNSSKTQHDIVVEIDRYIGWPGQALAYKIGELKFKELRSFAERELGSSFDIRSFHDALLGNGALPLAVLDSMIREWVGRQQKPT